MLRTVAPRAFAKFYTLPMFSWLRVLVVWLVALAIPAHGIAAATMQFCAPAQPQQIAGSEASATDHSHHGHSMDAGGSAKTPVSHDATQHAKVKCSACAACCMASALPPSIVTVPAVKLLVESARVAMKSYVGPDAAGLERPPKPRFA